MRSLPAPRAHRWLAALLMLSGLACSTPEPAPSPLPSILLVTLDTTRADAMEPEAPSATTPAFAALAARGVRFAHAYATAPQTLPSHASMLTGLYPAGHGVHDNGRRYDGRVPTIAERLRDAGYATAAFVSGFPLDRRFGLERGFDRYDDALDRDGIERSAAATTGRAVALLAGERRRPFFLWVHYYDPHEPYAPREPYRSRFPDDPYRGEVAAMDAELGRLVAAFEAAAAESGGRILVAGDHGEALGEHGERFHGNLLYQGVMRVPMVVAGDGIAPDVREEPVSVRRVFDTLLAWSGTKTDRTLLAAVDEPALGEAMQPYLLYGWQPQTMAIAGDLKAIRSGGVELYDVRADPPEARDLAETADLPRALREALRDYPIPSTAQTSDQEQALDTEARAKLASLGYLASGSPPKLRPDAPRPAAMTHLFADLDRASGLFERGEYAAAAPLLEQLLAADPGNLSVALRLAAAHSALGRREAATAAFDRAAAIDPQSLDLDHYRALHELRTGDWRAAGPRLERVLAATPDRLPALHALAEVRSRQDRLPEAIALLQRAAALEREPSPTWLEIGALAMAVGDTSTALDGFERARDLLGPRFANDLELGVLHLAAGRLDDAAAALDRVPGIHPDAPLALFKRAQVAVLRREPDAATRIRAARERADATTRELIAAERLFDGF